MSKPFSDLRNLVGKEDGFVLRALQFLREVKIELKKVAWPDRKQTIGSTAVVIVFVFILSLFLGIVDMSLSSIIRLILR
ncbi:MAG: preprotein translocase subunit SecE [Desulfobacterales bacterium]|nr:preprotein translocase subunit SecE [Desulfobacterales bacterium]